MKKNDHSEILISQLKKISGELRITLVKMMNAAQSGHLGGSLSAVEIVTALYFHQMRIDPEKPDWSDRDRFICSKGHAAPLLYATLAKRGYFPEDWLLTLRRLNSRLQGHPDMTKTPGIDINSGSLGHGLSVALGMCQGARLSRKAFRVYVLLGCGETQEGQIWEAAMAAAHYGISSLTAIMDFNKVQLDGTNEEIMSLGEVNDKWRAFGWETIEADGHDLKSVLDALDKAAAIKDKPAIIIAHTVKGKGVSFMEGKSEWHGKPISDQETEAALAELSEEGR